MICPKRFRGRRLEGETSGRGFSAVEIPQSQHLRAGTLLKVSPPPGVKTKVKAYGNLKKTIGMTFAKS